MRQDLEMYYCIIMVLLVRKAAPRVCPAGHHVPAASDSRPAGRVREVLPPQGQEGRDQTQADEAETEATRKVRHTPLFFLFLSCKIVEVGLVWY